MDDIISRQAVIDLIERMKPYHQTPDDIAEMIHNMPSAQPECEHTMEEFMYGQDMGNPEDGSL